jgi:hypothetical protein
MAAEDFERDFGYRFPFWIGWRPPLTSWPIRARARS